MKNRKHTAKIIVVQMTGHEKLSYSIYLIGMHRREAVTA